MLSIKARSYRLLGVLYETIFREKMGHETQKFFIGTSYAAIGILSGSLLTFIFTILGARILGPDNFGNLSLVTTLSVILIVPIAFSGNAAIKYASGAKDDLVRTKVISTSSILIALFAVTSTGIYVFFSPSLSQLLGVSVSVFRFGVAYAVTFAFFGLTTNCLRILLRMRAYALFSAVQSAIVLAVFLIFISYNMASWESAAYSLFISFVAISLILVAYLRDFIKLQFDRPWAKKIIKYSLLALPGSIALAFMGVDRLLINKFMTTADVGVYSAYFFPSLSMAIVLWGIVNVAFFPYASRSDDRQTIFRNVNKAAPYTAVLFVPLIVLLEAIFFFFYGHQYPFSLGLSFLFAIASAFSLLFQCYVYLMSSVGTTGARVSSLSSLLAFFVLISLDVVLIPAIGIPGAAITLIFAFLIPSVFLFSRRHVLG
jgi:O-antigen/teichoic acid export membrane protein